MSATAEDPAALTLGEALAAAADVPTLAWGRGLAALGGELLARPGLRTFTTDLPTAAGLGDRAQVGIVPEPGAERRWVLRVPPSRDELGVMVATAAARLGAGDQLWLAGHKRDGIKSAAKRLGPAFGPPSAQRVKRHCQVLVVTRTDAPAPPEPTLEALEARFDVAAGGASVTAVTLPGVFAHGRLDQGTERLVAFLGRDRPKYRRVLDLGCGSGVLSAVLGLLRPTATLALCDVSTLACRAAARTLALNDLTSRAQVHLLDATDAARLGPADLVVTNPPFHHGREADRSLVRPFVVAAAGAVAPRGQLLLVANRHLRYQEELGEAFGWVEIVDEDSRFRIWRARSPRR